jgi:hypothetical protein
VADDYHCFILDPQLTADRDLVGVEVVPSARQQVHHVLLYSTTRADAQAEDDAEAGEGWTCFGGPGTPNPLTLAGWVPGTRVIRYPATTGIPLVAGRVIVMQVHYNLANGRVPDRTAVKLQYANGRVPNPAALIPLPHADFRIPPGAVGYESSRNAVTIPGRLWGISPHMHKRGRRMRIAMGSTCLLDIPRWDFDWQEGYLYESPITLPASPSPLTLSCTWDNETGRFIEWGDGTEDEMCLAYFYVTR